MPEPLPNGTLLADKFRIVRLLGMGGMGAVYEIVHELTRHRRALKLLHPQWIVHQDVVERFLREASAAGRIGNPHIIETFDAGQLEGGEPYLVMELLVGLTLNSRIAEVGGLPITELVDVFSQACDGVQAAHDAGIVHRDLKPDNLFITSGGGRPFVKILDFGVSKFDARHTQMRETAGGQMIGTPLYMAPEQLWAEQAIDARADVYSLGVMLYESIAGVHPYPVDSMPALIARMSEEKITPLHEARPDVPAELIEVVAKAMAKDKAARFQTAKDLGNAVAALAASGPIDPLGQTLPVSDPPPVIAALAARSEVEPSARPAASAAPAPPEIASAPAPRRPELLLASNPSTSVTLPRSIDGRTRRTKAILAAGVAGCAALAIALAGRWGNQAAGPAIPGPEPTGVVSSAPATARSDAFPDPTATAIATEAPSASASPTSSPSSSTRPPVGSAPRGSSARPAPTAATSAKPRTTGDIAGKGEYP